MSDVSGGVASNAECGTYGRAEVDGSCSKWIGGFGGQGRAGEEGGR